jgi:hypothetical protein
MLWLLPLAHAACAPDLPTGLAALEGVETVDPAAIDQLLACSATADAARVHGLYARAYQGDPERAAKHLFAAWEADPLRPPALPTDHPASQKLIALQEGLTPSPMASPAPFLQIDGHPSTWVRTDMPYVAQGPGRPAVLVDAKHPFEAPKPEKTKGSGLLVAGLVSGGLAAGMYGSAWVTRDRYLELLDTNDPDNDARQLNHDWTNALSIGSVVGAVAGAGLLTVHVVR